MIRGLPRTSLAVALVSASACLTQQELGSHPKARAQDSGVDVATDGEGVDANWPDGRALDRDGDARKLLFVTENRYSGDLRTEGSAASGPAGADNLCMREAKAARIDGVFKAWISTTTEDAKDRFAPVGPWFLADGTLAAEGPALDGTLRWNARFSVGGTDLFGLDPTSHVWTGTRGDGTRDFQGRTCADWTSSSPADEGSYGLAGTVARYWTEYRDIDPTSHADPCDERKRLYCFEQ